MGNSKRKISYSVIRYSPDDLKNEIINVGLIFFDYENKEVKFFMLDEKSIKLKSIIDNNVELNIYKSYKNTLEFYLENCKNDLSGIVGEVYISSYFEDDFLKKLINYYDGTELKFSQINFAFTKNVDKLFATILNRYIGNTHVNTAKPSTMTVKKYMKQLFKSNQNLQKRIKNDILLKPIKELNDLEIKIDFLFKNGKWNYMQAIPGNPNKSAEWFTKIQFLLDETNKSETQLHLLYKKSEFEFDQSTYHLIKYLKSKYSSLEVHDIDEVSNVKSLCDYIENKAEILDEAI